MVYKTQYFTSKIEKILTFTTSIEHHTGKPSHYNKTRHGIKRHIISIHSLTTKNYPTQKYPCRNFSKESTQRRLE